MRKMTDQRYRDAFFSEAMLLYEVNLDKDLLEDELCGELEGREISLLPHVRMKAPCRFSEFVDKWAQMQVIPKDRADFREQLDIAYLKECYERREYKVCVEYHTLARYADGKSMVVRQTMRLEKNVQGELIGRVVVRDITEERVREEQLLLKLRAMTEANQKLTYVDELTGCPNKKGFFEFMKTRLEQYPESSYAIFYSDINNLSYVNSTFGYEVGNELIRYWSGCMKGYLRENEVLGRISGDYFAAFIRVESEARRAQLDVDFERVKNRVNAYFQKFDKHFHVDIYAGLYLITSEDIKAMELEQMLHRASIAQRSAKESGENTITYYNEEQWEKQCRGIEICQHLTSAIENGEIEAWIQPQYDYQDHKIIGAEVLSRWESGSLGRISPGEFIPVLEASGQIFELDIYIWELACKYLRKWLDTDGCAVVPLSVNISRRDVMQDDLPGLLLGLLNKYHLTTDMLRLEITESAYMDEPDKLIEVVRELQEYGFTIEMDDFGSGYSSLNMLKEVPVDILKMDLRFLVETGPDRKGGNIISSIIRMAQGLNIAVIAEGVEKVEQSDALRNMGCLMMQGYYFAKPMPYKAFEELLMTQKTGERRGKVLDANLVYIYDLMDAGSRSSYIFNHYSSGSAILEFDGKHVEIMSVNDEYLRAIGDNEGLCRQYMKDGLALVRDTDRKNALETVRLAVENGRAECEVYLPETMQWVRLTYRHVVKGRAADYLFSEAVNTTEEHRLSAQINQLMGEVNSQMDMLPVGAFRYEADGAQEFDFISDGLLSLLHYDSEEEFRKKFKNCFPELVYAEDRARVLSEINEQISRKGNHDYCEYRIETGDGSLKWVYDHGRLATDENGKNWFYVVIADLDEVKRERQERDLQAKKYQAFTRVPGILTFEYDIEEDAMTVHMIKAQDVLESFTMAPYLGQLEERWTSAETARAIRTVYAQAKKGAVNGTLRYTGRANSSKYHEYRCYYMSMTDENGRVSRIVGSAANIDVEAQEVSGWRRKARRDDMTKLLNHDATIESIRNYLRCGKGGTLMMMDVDNFKQINDSRGHLFGDEILRKVARALREQFRKSDVIGRYGGDEFVVFLPGVCEREFAVKKAENLMSVLEKIYISEERTVQVCIGIAIDDSGSRTAEELLFEADALMYDAKTHGKNRYKL